MTEKKTYHRLPSALSIYQKFESNQLSYDDISRNDMHFTMRTGADIVIEETGIHCRNPFKFKVEDVFDWSASQNDNLELILENYAKQFTQLEQQWSSELVPTYKSYFEHDGYNARQFDGPEAILSWCRERISKIRRTDDSLEAFVELEHRRKNCFDILWHTNGRHLDNLQLKTYLNDMTMTNSITVLQSVFEEEPKQNGEKFTPYAHKQRVYTFGEILELLSNPEINQRDKTTRPLFIPSTSGKRLVGEDAYLHWSGFQIFDVDLKRSAAFVDKTLSAATIRDTLFDKLKHYPWLLGITLSSSGKALHVYTKVSRMHNIFKEDEANTKIQKYWYRMSYMQKHAVLAYALATWCEIDDVYDNSKIMDAAAARVQQGIAMNYDPEAKWNSGFIDLYPVLFYHLPPEKGLSKEEWLTHPKIVAKYNAWYYDAAVNDDENESIQQRQSELKLIIDDTVTVDGVKQIDMNALAKGEKYSTRWRICNTIAYAYGDTDLTRELCHHILQTDKTGTAGPVNSFIRSAIINQKEADVFTIKQLRQLGLKIGFQEETAVEIEDEAVNKVQFMIERSDYVFRHVQPNVNIKLADNEFLGMHMKRIISHMADFRVNVIESAPNTGKTEFFKSLAKKAKVCLVIPFTSTIEAKIVSDESINKLFDVYYGDKKVSEIKKGRSVVMTFDKFAALPKSKYSMFDYIAIDESHLLFTSTYRLPVVSQTIENLRTYLLDDLSELRTTLTNVMSVNSLMSFIKEPTVIKQQTKFILMSGTLTGELDYFKHYGLLNYIKVHKQHPFKKSAKFVLTKWSDSRDVLIFKEIAEAIKSGKSIIHPTNKGDAYAKKVVSCVEDILGRTVKYEYYKRANADETFVELINKDTTVSDVEILFCSDYLSVGIDIKDTGNFKLIFSNDFTAESIEQFNNRLRSTDIDCTIFYDVLDPMGMQKPNIINTRQIEYVHNDELANMILDERAIAHLQKSIQNRSQYFAVLGEMFSKYFVQDFAGNIKYIRSAFEIEQFELQYSLIARSLLYIKTSLAQKYGYSIQVTFDESVTDEEIEKFDCLQKDAKTKHDLAKSLSFVQLVKFLSSDKVYEITQKQEYVFVKDSADIEDDDEGLHLGYDPNYLGGCFVITWNKKHKYTLDRAKKFVKRLRQLYSPATIDKILDSCTKTGGLINKTDINRYERLMKMLFDDRKHSLSQSTREILTIAYDYVEPSMKQTKLFREDYESMKQDIKLAIETNFTEITEMSLVSQRRQDNLQMLVGKFIDTLFYKRVSIDTVSLSFRKIYTFDSKTVQESIERDRIFRKILLNDDRPTQVDDTHDLSPQHFTLDVIISS